MKKAVVVLVAVLMIVSVGAIACESEEITPIPAVDAPGVSGLPLEAPWGDSECANYKVVDAASDSDVGTSELKVERDGDNYILARSNDFGSLTTEDVLVVQADDLVPISGNQVVNVTDQGKIEVVSKYSDSRVDINIKLTKTESEDGESAEQDDSTDEKNLIIGVPSAVYDSSETLFIGRALPLEVGYYIEFASTSSSQFMTPVVAFTVTGVEEVEAPVGTFDCYRVKFGDIASGTEQEATWMWYEVEAPHRLVKYSAGQNNFLLLE
ncbi:MAG: DUF3108 domain-containing protein [Dehalococcoidia bacterium]|nr:DUF3108 domain-containing protein [Dehalococcoidia bacterium]